MLSGNKRPLWIATGNSSKAKELCWLAEKFLPKLCPVQTREPKDVVESEPTFLGNAKLKTHALVQELLHERHTNFYVLGDDSGICVDLLEGRPGVHSARYAGPEATPDLNLKKLLEELAGVSLDLKQRTAQYRCVLHLVQVQNGKRVREFSSEGVRDGLIALTPQGSSGYAYDPIFLDPKTLRSYGDIPFEEKQTDSHRARAFQELQKALR